MNDGWRLRAGGRTASLPPRPAMRCPRGLGLGLALLAQACATFERASDLADEPRTGAHGTRWQTRFDPKSGLNYVITFPPGHDAHDHRPWPVVIFLHSLEERGDRLGPVVINDSGEGPGLAHFALSNPAFGYVTVSPLCPRGTHWFSIHERLDRLLREVVAVHHLDRRRIFLTGVSMGGMGTWSFAQAYPGWFAAIVPIAGGIYSPPMSSDLTGLVGVEVWAIHDRRDPSIPYEKSADAVRRLQALGGTARLTDTDRGEHYIHPLVYGDPRFVEWLDSRPSRSEPDPPPASAR